MKWYLLFAYHYIVYIISVILFHGRKIVPSSHPQELINLTLWTSMHWSFLPVDVIFFLHLIIIYTLFNWSLYILSSGISFWSYHGDCHSSSKKSIGSDWFGFQIPTDGFQIPTDGFQIPTDGFHQKKSMWWLLK